MKRIVLITVMLPVLITCSINGSELPDTPFGQDSSTTCYSIVVKDNNQTPLIASAMPDDFRLSDPATRIFDANKRGCIRVPENYAFSSLRILCSGYFPVDIHIDQFNEQNRIEVTLIEDPDFPDAGDGL